MATGTGVKKVNRVRDIDADGNIYYRRGISDIVYDPTRGISVKDDIDSLRTATASFLAYIGSNPKGMDGESAYEIAVDKGFDGTIKEWLASLKGKQGDDGLSAYEIAKTFYNFVGTQDEYMASLKGDQGDHGESVYELALRLGKTDKSESDWAAEIAAETISNDQIEDIFNTAVAKVEAARKAGAV